MPYGAVEWPSHAIAEPILHWIGIARPANAAAARALHDALHNTSGAFSPSLSSFGFLFDVYMPGQSELLFALFLIGVLTAVSVLLLFIVLFLLCTSRRRSSIIKCVGGTSATDAAGDAARTLATPSSASGVDAFSTDEKSRGSKRCQRILLLVVSVSLWLCLVLACALYACALGELASSASGPPAVPTTTATVGGSAAVAAVATAPVEHGSIDAAGNEPTPPRDSDVHGGTTPSAADGGGGRFGRNNKIVDDAAAEQLRKFEDVRELGYQFRALFSPSAPTLCLMFFVFIFYLTTLLLSLFATLIGMNQEGPHLYLPSGDHHVMLSAKERFANPASGRLARVRRTLASSAVAFLCAAPLMLVLSSALLVQAHAHLALCAQEQQTAQDLAIARYVSSNFGTVPPTAAGSADDDDAASIALPEFLADLKAERVGLNAENCRAEVAPLNALWLSSMLLALASLPFCLSVLTLLITTKCWSNGDESAGISLRAYFPGWVQSSALGPDTYKSIAPVTAGGQYQHYSISSRHGLQPPGDASQGSFGTFVYKKY